jgi:SAM-dependent methyltransferase
MPSMQEIYQKYSYEYDELISHEDYNNNLKIWLESNIDFNQKKVLEYGAGTGRITKLYIDKVNHAYCLDRSSHMLERCKDNLNDFNHKITYTLSDNDQAINGTTLFDIIIEGWSFGHTIIENKNNMKACIKKIISNCESMLDANGSMVFIETLGSNVEFAEAPSDNLNLFYSTLENEYGFKRDVIRTDYRFKDVDEAFRIFSFFFGYEMGNKIKNKVEPIVKEFTGIWYKKKS